MTKSTKSLALRLTRVGFLVALAGVVVPWLAYVGISATAETYQVVAFVDEAAIAANRYLYTEEPSGRDADILAIYGTPVGAPEVLALVDGELVVHPKEKPTLAWVRRVEGRAPLPLARVRFGVILASLVALTAALGLGLLRWWLQRSARVAAR